MPAARRLAPPELHRTLERWVTADLLTRAEADAIESFETRAAPAEPHGVPLVTEALVYVGVALTAAAAAALLGDRWEDLSSTVRLLAAAASSAIAFVAGWLLRGREDPALRRVQSVLWLGATGLFGWFAALVVIEGMDRHGDLPTIAAGIAVLAAGGILYLVTRRGAQQLCIAVGVLMIVGPTVPEGVPAMLAVWAVGVAWVLLGVARALEPRDTALIGGCVVALWAPFALGAADAGSVDAGMWLALGTGVAVLFGGVALREPFLLGLGALGVFGAVIRILVHLFGGSSAMPIALLVAGAGVLAIAIVVARRGGRQAPPATP